ncbi:MAG: glyoxylase-like metal-dependent hydrolase (beta-lactamase superfamily II) [Rhodococcus sp. (in: high G+C Gram-positive bacteria)]|jgi:glyoxylase-like metal-dependent hydrolase (beta-lactamase superfamily II)
MTLVSHVLACELEHGVVLIDAGIGTDDAESPVERLGRSVKLTGARLSKSESAAEQLERLGFDRADVTDVVATHLDYDHIGGYADFPNATLHTTAAELAEARHPTRTTGGNARYRRAHIAPIADAQTYSVCNTTVLGLDAHELDGLNGLFLIPMPGHTIGHAAVALIDPHRGWLVHAGDSFMHRDSIRPTTASPSFSGRVVGGIELLMATDRGQVRRNHRILRELAKTGIRVFCAHDAEQFKILQHEGGDLAFKP